MTLPSAPSDQLRLVGARSLRAAGIAGIVFAVLFTTSLLLLLGRPPAGATSAELAVWARDAEQRWFIGLQMIPFAGIAFLWFVATIRNRIGRREDQFLATVFIGSGFLFVAMMFAGGAAAAAPVTIAAVQQVALDPEAALIGRGIAYALYFVYGLKMAAVFILVSSTIGLRSGALPRWFCLLGYLTALVLLLVIFVSEVIVLVFPVWVTVASLILIFERDPLTAEGGSSPGESGGHEG
ncbi:MAG: hypothetical protein ABWY52_02175 [Candidatus Limnocylindrales bacterium]